jgi:ATP-dependent RNA circularization protein (DNA/RNA ligase family)
MKLDDANVYANMFNKLDMKRKLCQLGSNIAIQGEIIGPNIQGNKYKRAVQEFYVFDIYDIDRQRYASPAVQRELCRQLEIFHVPVLEEEAHYAIDLDDLLKLAEGHSILHATQREGLVYKAIGEDFSFKVISNKFLLKNE